MTASARSSSDCGIVRPIAFAVFMLMPSSNLVGAGCWPAFGSAPIAMPAPAARMNLRRSIMLLDLERRAFAPGRDATGRIRVRNRFFHQAIDVGVGVAGI